MRWFHPCLAVSNNWHHWSTTCRFFLGNLQRNCSAVALQAAGSCVMFCRSFLKTAVFLVFQSCQQDKAMSAKNSSLGTIGGLKLWMSIAIPAIAFIPIFSQNYIPMEQPLMMCSGVSSCSLQTSHVASGSTCLRCRIFWH